ncbi:MAG: GFA family protein [Cyanobacteria bacterium SBLK]|nr:GFA family protein [Cyanobacteria bacterium SBLK]
MAIGECNCGAIAFEIATNLSDVYICHCSICRRSTGSNGIAVVVVNNSDFRWVRGEELIKTWHKPGYDWHTNFCNNCGSPLPGVNDDARMYIPVGLITEGDENLQVAHHIWVDSKATWDEIGDNGKQHQQAFKG